MTRWAMSFVVALGSAAGCSTTDEAGGAPTAERSVCADELAELRTQCEASGSSGSCDLIVAEFEADCEAKATGKADSVSGLLKQSWMDSGDECFHEGDLDCVVDHFEWAVWGWRWVYGYDDAANALENFLTCESEQYVLSEESMFDTLEGNGHFDDWYSIGAVLEESRQDARIWLEDPDVRADWPVQTELPSFGVVHGSENVRLTVGRFTIDVTAELDWWDEDEQRGALELVYTFRDRYDFHPDRSDEHSGGQPYSSKFPYHAWAVKLVEEGRACEYDVVGRYERRIELDAAFFAE